MSMTSTFRLKFRIYGNGGDLVGATYYAEDAAILVANTPEGVVAVHEPGHAPVVVWREGHEETSAADSADHAAFIMTTRAGWNGK